ncbi:M23 family metallopeptidase [bacterium]|nr:M23 family metallopeptidase [bacterium]
MLKDLSVIFSRLRLLAIQVLVVAMFISCSESQKTDSQNTTNETSPTSRQSQNETVNPETQRTESPLPDIVEFTSHDTIQKGDTFSSILRRNEVPNDQGIAASYLLGRSTDMRKLPIGTSVDIRMADSGLVRMVLAPPKFHLNYRIDRTGHMQFVCFVDTLDTDTTAFRISGEVSKTLYNAFLDIGETPYMAIKFIEIFQFVHYFSSETRVGDKFNLIIEKISYEGNEIGYGRILAAQYIGAKDTLTAVWRGDNNSEFGGDYFNDEGQSFRRDLLLAPFPAARVTSTYGLRKHPISGKVKKHHGIDFGAGAGTPIVAAGNGVITKAIKGNTGLGNWLHIKHGDTGFETRYGHLRAFAKGIKKGAVVKQGQKIGFVGQTGYATGPHLHYETFRDGNRIDPYLVKGSPVQQLSKTELAEFLEKQYVPRRTWLENPGYMDVADGYKGPLPETLNTGPYHVELKPTSD